jgi:multicomponent Na+:H+ antiporter subunit D
VLPWQVGYEPYDVTHVVTQLQLLFWSAMAFAWLQRTGLYPPELPSTNLDADWVFRRGGPRALARLGGAIATRTDAADARLARLGDRIWRGMLRAHGPRGVLARTWPTESSMLWMAVLLGVLLILYYR